MTEASRRYGVIFFYTTAKQVTSPFFYLTEHQGLEASTLYYKKLALGTIFPQPTYHNGSRPLS